MTYLGLMVRLASEINKESVSLAERKLFVILREYGVLKEALKIAPRKMGKVSLGRDKTKALDTIMRAVFAAAGENYPRLEFDAVIALGRKIVAGLEEGT